MSIGGNAYGNSGVQAPNADETGYCTQQDLEYRITAKTLTQLTNDVTNAGEPNPAIVADLIEEAQATIDSIVGVYYTVPFTTVPTVIKNICADIACYLAMQRQSFNTDIPKSWQKTYDEAMKTLEAIVAGSIKLPAAATVASSSSSMNTDRGAEIDFNDEDSELYNY